MKKIFLFGALALLPALSRGEEDTPRDRFVREVVATLLQTQAAHISPEDTVDRAYRAWVRYQSLIEAAQENRQVSPEVK
jgi:hypothetical protein